MAKVTGPLFSMGASGSFGDIVFDRRGIARFKVAQRDSQTATQGDFRQAMSVAQKCVKVCGPTTRELLKGSAEDPSTWHIHLVKYLIGSHRAAFDAAWQLYKSDPEVDQAGWETAAGELGLRPVSVDYATETGVSPGAQLFILASTLFSLGLYATVGQPNGNAAAWKAQIGS